MRDPFERFADEFDIKLGFTSPNMYRVVGATPARGEPRIAANIDKLERMNQPERDADHIKDRCQGLTTFY